jgi:uncharacterized protein involved in type VI secretion and phage assembly
MAREVSFDLTQQFKKREEEKKIFGVTVCTVVDNIDCTGGARVQLSLPWLPGFQPWARMSNMMGGMGRGSYFIPQIGDEVLVSFNHGDVREPYVLGTLWNSMDRPPTVSPTDAVTMRKIRTPLGHELSFDEAKQAVTLASNTMSTVTLDPQKAQISTPTATITIGKLGDVTIKAATKLTLEAPVIEINADTLISANSRGGAAFGADGLCIIKGAAVKIN